MKNKKKVSKFNEISKKELDKVRGGRGDGPFIHSLSNLEDPRI